MMSGSNFDGLDFDLCALTAQNFADWPAAANAKVTEIQKGGSGRRYFRLADANHDTDGVGNSIIVMVYTLDRPENLDFAPITDFLSSRRVAVPTIRARDEHRRILWIEDLGEADLWTLRKDDWDSVRRPAYEATLRAVRNIHQLTELECARLNESSPAPVAATGGTCAVPKFQPAFDEAMYRWEQSYFFEKFLGRFSTESPETLQEAQASPALADLASGLAALPRTLVHRDFQSQNVMIPGGHPRFIDYQGMRFGRPEYDVASLIFDPYVKLGEAERDHLARYYHSLTGEAEPFEDFEQRLLQCGAQRLMQALGAYGFLGVDKGLKMFLEHIPAALPTLRWVVEKRGTLPVLAPLLKADSIRVA